MLPIGKLQGVVKNGEIVIRALVVHCITDLSKFFNLGENNNLNDTQIAQTADMIIQKYNYLKVDDFKVCFNNAKTGMYGKVYNRLDGQIIFEWLNTYCNERAAEVERLNMLKHTEQKTEKVKPNEINPEGQKKVIEILSSCIKQVEVKPEKKPVEKTEQQKNIQKFLSQFDRLFMKRPVKANGKFIKRYGKVMGQVEYTEHKLNQLEQVKIYVNNRKNRSI